ncbi:MAG: toll/interleukin-1 receptor domain-containing protein [bacterium]|nr:MAG: toll/interleukin-1 receptor domain-containing protein [bacterium]
MVIATHKIFFISYSDEDKKITLNVLRVLEEEGLKVWMGS